MVEPAKDIAADKVKTNAAPAKKYEGIVTLVTEEGEKVELDANIAVKSVLLQNLIDDAGTEEEIPLPTVKKAILQKILEFMTYMMDHETPTLTKPLRSDKMEENVEDEWYAKYIDIDNDLTWDLITAANYMDVKPCCDLACAKIAVQMRGKTIIELRKFLDIENDFTPEEEAKANEQYKWSTEAF